ncbi:unnamed protein product [Oikopleura dioica]|uniref:Uncharacterized protein n=1 Tax=Oikopleura dioica TaxID=34765 RepID=E4Y6Z3_OIKDI|nr:unnamed protein product [Oikopleura dioica]
MPRQTREPPRETKPVKSPNKTVQTSQNKTRPQKKSPQKKTQAAKKPMQKKTGPQKTVTQKTAIDRLNKARATLQKAVKAVNDANKKLEKTLTPAQKKAAIPKKTPQKKAGGAPQRKPVQKNQNNRVQRQQNNKVQKRGNQQGNNQQKRNKTGGVSIKINNRGPSGRGRGKAQVVRDTLKSHANQETNLDDRFSQLLKSAGRKVNANRGGRGGARGGRGGGAQKRGGRGGNRRY